MSYLDVPRLHFAGLFASDPSTLNNDLGTCCGGSEPPANCAYDNLATPDPRWNPDGKHHFRLVNCDVRSAIDGTGAVHTDAAGDKLVGGVVEAFPDGRIVDLDPSFQLGSQVWGLGVRVTTSTGESVSGTMATATLRELWDARTPDGFAAGFGGAYQSVLTDLTWSPPGPPYKSAVLGALQATDRLSIRMVCFAYNADSRTPGFTQGELVGTIGPAALGEPAHGSAERRMVHGGTFQDVPLNSAAFNAAPFKVDAARQRLVIDLGNALPEDTPAGARPATLAPLEAQIADPRPLRPADPVGVLSFDRPHYLERAGVEELPLTAAQVTAIASRPLRIVTTGPPVSLRLAEGARAVHLEVSETVVRLNPGESRDLSVIVTAFGRPLANRSVHVDASRPGGAVTAISVRTGAGFATPVALPGRIRTNAAGVAKLRLVAGNPLHPRTHIDGQVSFVGLFLTSVSQANKRAEISVRVFDIHTVPATPQWADVERILVQYSRLYPSMRKICDLADRVQVKAWSGPLAAAMRRAESAPNYMPVTRDLSRDKKALLLKWLDAGAP